VPASRWFLEHECEGHLLYPRVGRAVRTFDTSGQSTVSQLHPVALAGLLYCGAGIGAALLRRTIVPRGEAALSRDQVPYLVGAIVAGGIIGPVLLMVGLARTEAATG
jgi:drug/metabolite transporter (DMT)-like permease